MNSTLWVFGDSFSEDIKILPHTTERVKYSKHFLNKEYYKTWGELLAEKLNYEYKNFSALGGISVGKTGNGNTNDDLLTNILFHMGEFKKDDIIFIGFTDFGRFRVPREDGNIHQIHPNTPDLYIPNILSINELNKICVLRSNALLFYLIEFYMRMKFVHTLENKIGFKIFYWSWVSTIEKTLHTFDFFENKKSIFFEILKLPNFNFTYKDINYSYMHIFEKFGIPPTITDHTNGSFNDGHQSELAHEFHANLIYNHIINSFK
jgi:hypothetical protein